MSRIKSLFRIFMRRRGWVPLADFNEGARLMHLAHRQLRELQAKVGNIETREARIKQLEVGTKAIPSKTEDIRQHLTGPMELEGEG